MDFLQSIDRWVSLFFSGINCPAIDFLMVLFSTVAEFGAIYIVISLCLFIFKKDRKQAIVILVSLLLSVVFCHVLKDIFDRTRPFIELGIDIIVSPPLGSSFPSAHSSTAFTFAAVMVWFYGKRSPWLAISSVVLADFVAFSRIWLCVHYVSDVVAGSLFGITVGVLTVVLCEYLCKKYFSGKYKN